jgi:predicted DNA-binding protein YlxM (UPF0122 family)
MTKTQELLQSQIEVSELFHIYGELLSERQRSFIQLYYDENLSLSEIAVRHEISRQAVHDAIKHGRRALLEYERTLHLLSRHRKEGRTLQSPLWAMNVEAVLEEMEKAILEGPVGQESRLLAQVASLRDLLITPAEMDGLREPCKEEAAA